MLPRHRIHAAVEMWLGFAAVVLAGGLPRQDDDLSLWIDERQVRMFSGFPMEIYAVVDGHVLPYIFDPKLADYLPVIPADVAYVNISWKSGRNKYYYQFEVLHSLTSDILRDPLVSVPLQGRIPMKPQVFSLHLPCSGRMRGIATFDVCLIIRDAKGSVVPGLPLRLRLQKQCNQIDSGPICGPFCGPKAKVTCSSKSCACSPGYTGHRCDTAICQPQCQNGGFCSAPDHCTCAEGFFGSYCEQTFCQKNCLNGGKCWKRNRCRCSAGYFGTHCQHSKCAEECQNGGHCIGPNKCHCHRRYRGTFCEIPKGRSCNKHHRHKKCQSSLGSNNYIASVVEPWDRGSETIS